MVTHTGYKRSQHNMLTKLAPKVVVDPQIALRDTDVSSSQEEAAPVEGVVEGVVEQPIEYIEKIWEFVKNIQTQEVLTFKDGSTYQFPSSLLVTADKKLAEKILSVADKYHIIQR